MSDDQRNILLAYKTDVDGALFRFGGNEKLYISCLSEFLRDTSMRAFAAAMAAQVWQDAFTAVHTLKGIAGNMGFAPIAEAAERTTALLRAGRYRQAEDSAAQLERQYSAITQGVKAFLAQTDRV